MAKKGRKSVEQSQELRDEYIKIWSDYNISNLTWQEVAKKRGCSRSKVYRGIQWVSENHLELPPKVLLVGAVDAVKDRLKQNKGIYQEEASKKKRNIRDLASFNKEIRADQKFLFELESIYRKEYAIKSENKILTTPEVLKIITTADKDADKDKD